ncbi:MAG: P-loop containing nucleoside triphosphate hydrolase protein [Linnemannia gamsii]|nr:MAG: P-loop containing nucleoside triphosphate hydrolase protein [Linnemannia gamsii]
MEKLAVLLAALSRISSTVSFCSWERVSFLSCSPSSFLSLLLDSYIDAVIPSEYGVRRPWHFPISGFFKPRSSVFRHYRDVESKVINGSNHTNPTTAFDQESMDSGDADIHAERECVRIKYDPSTTPLIIDDLYHCYSGKAEPALRSMSFGVENNTVLGLLGPNGAGKSTLIHLLTGLYNPTEGSASVAGANIRTEMSLVHSKIGVYPQHDILWDDLTIADNLLFLLSASRCAPCLRATVVSLTKLRDRQVKGLSGSERRRISIVIALLGDNRVIFLDEPSAGLDPEVRRVIWNIVKRVKVNRTVVLTTHSMEEADILAHRIAIMTNGQLRCIGTSLHLKELYGSGFRLKINSKPGQLDQACQSVEDHLMRRIGLSHRRIDKFTNSSVFEFDLAQVANGRKRQQDGIVSRRGELSSIFHLLSQPDLFPAVEDWDISQTTLEDVFFKIVTGYDTSLTVPEIIHDIKED